VVNADDKKRARLNCIAHLLQQVPYQDMVPVEVELPPPQANEGYERPKMSSQLQELTDLLEPKRNRESALRREKAPEEDPDWATARTKRGLA
jgi:hypothetical protein